MGRTRHIDFGRVGGSAESYGRLPRCEVEAKKRDGGSGRPGGRGELGGRRGCLRENGCGRHSKEPVAGGFSYLISHLDLDILRYSVCGDPVRHRHINLECGEIRRLGGMFWLWGE